MFCVRLFLMCFTDDDDDEEGGEEKMPTCTDYVLHFLTVFWKILFAFVPPTGDVAHLSTRLFDALPVSIVSFIISINS